MDGVGCHFRVVSSGKFIYKLKNTIKCKKCGRTKALLGTYALFHMKLTLFFQVAVHGCQFWVIFDGEFIPTVKNPIGCKKCAGTQHFQALVCIFMYTYTFSWNGCWWVSFLCCVLLMHVYPRLSIISIIIKNYTLFIL